MKINIKVYFSILCETRTNENWIEPYKAPIYISARETTCDESFIDACNLKFSHRSITLNLHEH